MSETTTTYSVTIPEGVIHTDRSMEQASAVEKFELTPGTYEVRLVTIGHQPVREGQTAYYYAVSIPATRVFYQYSPREKADTERTATTVRLWDYSYLLTDRKNPTLPVGGFHLPIEAR